MSEFGGLWKQNNFACTKSVKSLHNLKLDFRKGILQSIVSACTWAGQDKNSKKV